MTALQSAVAVEVDQEVDHLLLLLLLLHTQGEEVKVEEGIIISSFTLGRL